jgi:uncharacterized protein YggU (UPF0235/DUF167 family)
MTPQKKYELHDGQKGAALAIRVTPRSTKNQITEISSDGTVKIRLVGAADDNKSLVEFLAGVLGSTPARLDVVAGVNGNDKLVSVLDMDAETVHKKILEHLT